MADEDTSDKTSRYVPAPRPRAPVTIPSPHLPSLAGPFSIFGSRTTVARRNAKFVQAHADFLKARANQSQAMGDLVDARIGLAVRLARLATIQDVIENEHVLSRMDRQHAVHMRALQQQTKEALAELELAQARARLHPHRNGAASATASDDFVQMVDDWVAQMPDVPEEARNTLREFLASAVKEKKL